MPMTRRRHGSLPAIVLLRRQRAVKGLKIVRRLPSSGPGFLTLDRFLVRNVYAGGRTSPPYRSEVLHRRGIDAVAIVPFFFAGRPRRLMVICKTGFRPGLSTRSGMPLPVRDRRIYLSVIEAVAGSLEPGDRGEAGVSARARAELLEETGLKPKGGRIIRLGSGFFPSHGQSTEKIHLRAFEVDPRRQVAEAGDGSVNEADSGTIAIEAGRILDMCRSGLIEDPKVEIGVSRLLRLKGHRLPRKS